MDAFSILHSKLVLFYWWDGCMSVFAFAFVLSFCWDYWIDFVIRYLFDLLNKKFWSFGELEGHKVPLVELD